MYPANIISSVPNNNYLIAILLQVTIHVGMLYTFLIGLNYFPGQDLISISQSNKWMKILFLLPIFVYLIMTYIISIMLYAQIITIIFLDKTPMFAVIILIVCTSSYLAALGIKTIFRTSIVVAILFVPIILLTLILTYENMDIHNVYPIISKDFSFFMKKEYLNSFFAISGSFLFIGFINPSINFNKKKLLYNILIITPFYILAIYIPILFLGHNTAKLLVYPFVISLDTLDISWSMFERITIFFSLSLLTFNIIFIGLTLWQIITISQHYAKKINKYILIFFFSLLGVCSYILVPNWKRIQLFFNIDTGLRMYIIFVIPLILYFMGRITKKKKDGLV